MGVLHTRIAIILFTYQKMSQNTPLIHLFLSHLHSLLSLFRAGLRVWLRISTRKPLVGIVVGISYQFPVMPPTMIIGVVGITTRYVTSKHRRTNIIRTHINTVTNFPAPNTSITVCSILVPRSH